MSKHVVRKIITSPLAAAAPNAPYSQAVQVGHTLYCSGVLGLDAATGQLVPGGTIAQAKQAFVNLEHVLRAAGTSLDNVVKMTVLFQDLKDFKDVNELYGGVFKKPYPARTAYQVAALPLGGLIEMEAIAIIGDVETISS